MLIGGLIAITGIGCGGLMLGWEMVPCAVLVTLVAGPALGRTRVSMKASPVVPALSTARLAVMVPVPGAQALTVKPGKSQPTSSSSGGSVSAKASEPQVVATSPLQR
jgi:hypothetical protein